MAIRSMLTMQGQLHRVLVSVSRCHSPLIVLVTLLLMFGILWPQRAIE